MQQEKDINKLMKWNLGFTLLWRTIIYGLDTNESTTLFLPSTFSPPKISLLLMQLQVDFCIKIFLSVPLPIHSLHCHAIRTVFVGLRVDTNLLLEMYHCQCLFISRHISLSERCPAQYRHPTFLSLSSLSSQILTLL